MSPSAQQWSLPRVSFGWAEASFALEPLFQNPSVSSPSAACQGRRSGQASATWLKSRHASALLLSLDWAHCNGAPSPISPRPVGQGSISSPSGGEDAALHRGLGPFVALWLCVRFFGSHEGTKPQRNFIHPVTSCPYLPAGRIFQNPFVSNVFETRECLVSVP
jgi:hypothetical protein